MGDKRMGLWFEARKEKREQMFVYKSVGGKTNENDEDDETMPDPEDLEIQALLPNFDDTDFGAAVDAQNISSVQSRLPDAKDLCTIVDLLINSGNNNTSKNSDTLLSTVWLLDFF
uniref:Uncharacterized protein n=1 Tax=Panagrolaimus sp. PS1159 TaxID=55785 RepID=A0AC35G7P7_9BILA